MVKMMIHMQGKGGQLNSKSRNQKVVRVVTAVRMVATSMCKDRHNEADN